MAEVDRDLYSRQLFVVGHSAQVKMSRASVLLVGADGVAAEIAKNLALSGVKRIAFCDDAPAAHADLSTNCFLRAEDVGSSRAAATARAVAELNPNVEVTTAASAALEGFQCVVVCGGSGRAAVELNRACRERGVHFLWATVRGVFSRLFVDGGEEHVVEDRTGETLRSFYVGGISRAEEGVVEVLQGEESHDLESGDTVRFTEIGGMTELEGQERQVRVINRRSFAIGDTSGLSPWTVGGVCVKVNVPHTMRFGSLEERLAAPEFEYTDWAKMDSPPALHAGMPALDAFEAQHGRAPRAWDAADADAVVALLAGDAQLDEAQVATVRKLALTARGAFAPLVAAVGGWMAQEALKLITNKFTPQGNWVYLDYSAVLPRDQEGPMQLDADDRYAAQRVCLGDAVVARLAALRVFIVGAGAIGCEHLKNLALLGVGLRDQGGSVSVTDPDGIEKSNLSRQFLFRAHDISKSKSLVAAQAAQRINPDIRCSAQMTKICPEKENVFSDAFFEGVDCILTAVDNVKARVYVDRRAVGTRTPLFESGTLGTKGHVQTVLPMLTESYGAQPDPPEHDVPMCTVKHFPSSMEHTIQWARDKFYAVLTLKLEQAARFLEDASFLQRMSTSEHARRKLLRQLRSALLTNRPRDYADCLRNARVRYEKYFCHKTRQLLAVYPPDHTLDSGTLFWTPPRRMPTECAFSPDSQLDMDFVTSCAALLATAYGIPLPTEVDDAFVLRTLAETELPECVVNPQKRIVSDTTVSASEAAAVAEADAAAEEVDEAEYAELEAQLLALREEEEGGVTVQPLHFEKDDDAHIFFVEAAAGLRSTAYRLPVPSFMEAKKIAGAIVPAIATTTSVVSALSVAELVKHAAGCEAEQMCNTFLNLALPFMAQAEPSPPKTKTLAEGVQVTEWTRWDVQGRDLTLAEFLEHFEREFGLRVSHFSLARGQEVLYHAVMAPAAPRTKMRKLLGCKARTRYVDLAVSLKPLDAAPGSELIEGPVVRFVPVDP